MKVFLSAFRHSLTTGFSFGSTSGIITTLGLMVGLNSGTASREVVLAGILTIALADAFSDALGIHVSEEAENVHTPTQVWASTFSTFFSKLTVALTFVVPVLLLPLSQAVVASIIWGLGVLGVASYLMAKHNGGNAVEIVCEHIFIAVVVVIISNLIGSEIREHIL